MEQILTEGRFDFLSQHDKAFVVAFNGAMTRLGYQSEDKFGGGYCWGRYMLIYTKAGVKSNKVFARVYLRDEDIVLRLFFSKIDDHRAYIEQAPAHIKEVFTGKFGTCEHCGNQKEDGTCMFRKTYTIDGRFIEKCNGNTFWFFRPRVADLPDYLDLFSEFYPARKGKKA